MNNIYSEMLNIRKDNFYDGTNIIKGVAKYRKMDVDVDRYLQSAIQVVLNNEMFHSYADLSNQDVQIYTKKGSEEDLVEVIYLSSEEQVIDFVEKFQVKDEFIKNNHRIISLKIILTDEWLFLCCIGHHAISDGRSMYNIINEISEVYINKNYYKQNDIKKMKQKDIFEQQQKYLNSKRFHRDYEYWEKKLRSVDNSAPFPNLEKANRYVHRLPDSLIDELFTISENNQVDILSLLIVTIANIEPVLLNQHGSVQAIGFVTDTRNRAEYSTMNMYVNNISLTFSQIHEKRIVDALTDVGKEIMSSLRASKFPVAKYMDGKYNILISYHKTPMTTHNLQPLSEYWAGPDKISVPMVVTFKQRGTDLYIECDYKISNFDQELIKRFFKMFESVLTHIIASIRSGKQEELLLRDIPLTLRKKRIKDPDPNVLTKHRIHNLQNAIYENLVSLHKEAIVCGHESITYKQLNIQSNKVANYLQKERITKVGIWGEKNIQYIIGIVGAIKAGVTYIPLSPKTPKNHIEFIQEQHDLTLLNSNSEEKTDYRTIESILSEYSFPLGKTWDVANDETCIIYTSGTTGTPKGIPIKNSSIDHVVRQQPQLKIEPSDHLLLIADTTFDISLFSIFGSLANGATLILINQEKLFEEGYLKTIIANYPNAISCITPGIIKSLPIDTWNHMKFVTCGGEKMDKILAEELLEVKETTIFNAYGPTEATILCTLFKLDHRVKQLSTIPIGYPIHSMNMLIVDPLGRVLPDYFEGELLINGPGVMDGYYHSEKDPFFLIDGDTYYRSGDSCKMTEDGIYFINRLDNQIKINGYRIELDAIEAQLRNALHGIEFVIDVFRNSIYVYTTQQIDTKEISHQLIEALPEYMVPKVYIAVPEIPLTKNHKVDFGKLRNHIQHDTSVEMNHAEKTQVILTEMCHVLDIEEVDPKESFLSYGGNSLKAMELAARINETYETTLTSIDVLKYKYVHDIAANITMYGQRTISTEYINPLSQEGTPLSHMQQMMAVDYLLDPASTKYLMCKVFKADSIKHAKQFMQAFEKVINKHPIFKVNVVQQGGHFVQKVNQTFQIQKQMKPLDTIPNWSELLRPFDLFTDPLVRLSLYPIQQTFYIMIEIHHLCADATTILQLLKEVQQVYEGNEPEPLPFDYAYYIAYEKEQLTSTDFTQQKEGIVEKFRHVKKLTFPTLSGSIQSNQLQHKVNGDVYKHIKNIQKELNVSLQTVVLSALGFIGSRMSGEHEFMLGIPVSLRDRMNLSSVLGPIINTIPCKISVSQEETVSSYITGVQNEILDALSRKHIPLSEILKEFPEQTSMFDVVALVQELVDTSKIDGISEIETPVIDEKFKMTYQFIENGEELILDLSFKDYQTVEIARIIKAFEESIILFITNFDEKLSTVNFTHELSIVEPEKENFDTTIWDHVLQSAKHTPNQLALFRSNRTYEQMIEDINRITSGLQDLGITRGDVVAHTYERSDEGILIQLAISRLGAAYLPVNSELTKAQIDEILRSTEVVLLIGEEQHFIKTVSFQQLFETEAAVEAVFNIARPSDLLYIMFSSGTTGKPKGIKISHKNVIAFIMYGEFYKANPGDRVAQISNNGFDGSTFDIYRAICNSGELHVLSTEEVKNPISLFNYIKDHQIMTFFMPASYFNLLVDAFDLSEWNAITQMYIGGERLSKKHVEKGLAMMKGQIINGYGPTETTVFVSTEVLSKEGICPVIPIGKPLAHHKIYVLDDHLNPVPKGVIGELYVGGPSICEGFLNANEAEQFIWNQDMSERLYKTGDFVLMDEFNKLYFIGRKDDQIKHFGYRINLSEIEKNLEAIPNVEKATILYVQNEIIAYIKLKQGGRLTQVQEVITSRFAKYMQPTKVIQVDTFHLNSNGKIDKQKLKEKSL